VNSIIGVFFLLKHSLFLRFFWHCGGLEKGLLGGLFLELSPLILQSLLAFSFFFSSLLYSKYQISLCLMEVLAKLGVDWKLLLAQVVNFLVLLWVLRRFAYKPMLKFLDDRSKKIEAGLRDAKRASEKLSEIEQREREVLEAAKKESGAIVARAKESAEKMGEKIMTESREEAARIMTETRKKIENERESLRTDMKQELAGLVLLATEKVLGEKMKDAKDETLVREAVKNL